MFFSSINEVNRLISKGMSNIYYWTKLTFSKLRFSRKENLKKCTSFEEQKGTRYTWGNVCFGIIVFNCLLSTKSCLRFPLICFAREIKGFYQSSLGNEIDFTDIMNVSPNILAKYWNFKTEARSCRWKSNDYNIDLLVTEKRLYLFACERKNLKKHF